MSYSMHAERVHRIAPEFHWIATRNTRLEHSHTRTRRTIVAPFQPLHPAQPNLVSVTAAVLIRKAFGLHMVRFLLATTRIYGLSPLSRLAVSATLTSSCCRFSTRQHKAMAC